MPRLSLRLPAALAVVLLAVTAGDRAAVAVQFPVVSPSLTHPIALAAPRVQAPAEAWERRTRPVAFNPAALPERGLPGSVPDAGAQVSIDLFDGRSITAVFERFDPNATGVTWVGTVPGVSGSRVTLVSGGGLLAASIVLPEASYTIRPQSLASPDAVPPPASTVHILTEIDENGFLPEAPPLLAEVQEMALERAADAVMTDTGEFVDLLVVFTAAAEQWAGGLVGVHNLINLGVSETNSAFASSGVFTRIRLVNAERVNYSEVSSFNTNLTNLRGGVIPNVQALREAYTADLVAMIVRPLNPSACGIAFLMTTVSTAFAPNAYSVTDATCIGGATLAHEIGHNMGLRHDWYMDSSITPFTYAHGYVNVPGRFRTIMAYPDSCSSLGFSCTRLRVFSNPEQTHLGQPLGIAGGTSTACPTGNANNMSCDADERRALNETAFSVSNFREFSFLRPPLIVSHPLSQSVPRGQSMTLQVSADGLGPFSYQWFRGASPSTASPIAGATGPTYTFVPGADGVWFERWYYWVRVTNSIGGSNSFTASVTLLQPGAAADDARRGDQLLRRGDARDSRVRRDAPATGTARPRVSDVAPLRQAPLRPLRVEALIDVLDADAAGCSVDPDLVRALAVVAERSWQPAAAAKIATWLLKKAAGVDDPVCRVVK